MLRETLIECEEEIRAETRRNVIRNEERE